MPVVAGNGQTELRYREQIVLAALLSLLDYVQANCQPYQKYWAIHPNVDVLSASFLERRHRDSLACGLRPVLRCFLTRSVTKGKAEEMTWFSAILHLSPVEGCF